MTAGRVHRARGGALGLLVVLLIGAAGAWLGWRGRPHVDGHKTLPQTPAAPFPLAICDGMASYAEAVVTGEVRLHQAFLGNQLLSADELQNAVALQLRYAFASSQNAPAGPTTLTPDGPPHSVEILAQRNIPYGSDLDLDWPADPQLQPESDYVQRALARRKVSSADAAVAVAYRARVGLALCDKNNDSARQTVFRFPVPHDPYLLYWHIGKEQRIVQVYGEKRALTFPCADPEIADYDHPEYLWYFWQPLRKEPDCSGLLPAPRVLGWASLRIIERLAPSGDFTRFKASFASAAAGAAPEQPLRVVLVFGYLDHQAGRPDPAQLQKCWSAAASDHPQSLATECSYDEWGAVQYGSFLQMTGAVIDAEDRVVRSHRDGLEAQISGRLRRSGRRIAMTAYLTETDFLAPPQYAPRHIPLLMDALREAEVIVYVGHSGLGANFSITQLQKNVSRAAVDEALRSSPARVLGFVGCYTYSYFGRDFGQSTGGLGGPGREAMFVYTGNAVEQTAKSALHILATLDCILQSPDGPLRPEACDLSRVGDPARPDFLIYEFAR